LPDSTSALEQLGRFNEEHGAVENRS